MKVKSKQGILLSISVENMICLFIFKKWFCLMLALIKCSTANFGNTVLSTYGSNFGAATEPLRLR